MAALTTGPSSLSQRTSCSIPNRLATPAATQQLPLCGLSTAPLSRRCRSPQRPGTVLCASAASSNGAVATREAPEDAASVRGRRPKVLIAGGGIGGLVLSVALLNKGFDIQVFERDLTAIRGEGKYRGPIQVQSNALAALEAIDQDVAEQVLAAGCITGDRVNGLCDGVTGKWYVKFDTFHPAVDRGLPVTRVISRTLLQQILAEAVRKHPLGGEGTIMNDANVAGFEEKKDEHGRRQVWAILEDGRRFQGDILVGADGIWSKIRKHLVGDAQPNYSEYTCYTGISDFTPPDIDTVGYRVFLGNGKYFVSSDVGGGKMQWYGFHKEPAGGTDPEGRKKERLLQIFGHWTDMVTDLIKATPEEDVLRRDIFDRRPIFTWCNSRVTLLGDSAHAMQPNLGQGGCMAIEDGYQLAVDLAKALQRDGDGDADKVAWERVLKDYQNKRILRTSTIHGLAGMAAIMASTYKAYLGEGLGPLSFLTKLQIPHPGRVGGYFAMNLTMPSVLSWVLGGNMAAFGDSSRAPHCRISDKPQGFDERDFPLFMRDDDALLRRAKAEWLVVPAHASEAAYHKAEEGAWNTIALPPGSMGVDESGVVIGRDPSCTARIDHQQVSARHVTIAKAGDGDYALTVHATPTWLNERAINAGQTCRLKPGDKIEVGERGSPDATFCIKLCHHSLYRPRGTGNAEDAAREPVLAA